MIIWIGIMVVAAMCLGYCWYLDEVSQRTKIIFTALYLASWGLFFLPPQYGYAFPLAQLVLIGVIGVSTFGLDWLIGSR